MQNKEFETEKKNVWDREECASVCREFCKVIFMIRNNLVVGNETVVARKFNIGAKSLCCEWPMHLVWDTAQPRSCSCFPMRMCRKYCRHRLKSCSICPLLPLLCPKKPALSLRRGVGFRTWQSCICRQTKGEQKAKQDATAKPSQVLSFVVFFKWNANRDLMKVL